MVDIEIKKAVAICEILGLSLRSFTERSAVMEIFQGNRKQKINRFFEIAQKIRKECEDVTTQKAHDDGDNIIIEFSKKF